MRYAALQLVLITALGATVAAQSPPDNPTGPLTLDEAVRVALLQSPDLAAYDWGRRAAEARRLFADRRPTPTAGVLGEDIGSSERAGLQPQVTLQLSQLVELGGKRAARVQVADREQALSVIEYEVARLDVLSRVHEDFRSVLARQESLTLAERALSLATEVARTVRERVAAGVVSPIEETRAELLVSTAEQDVAEARHTLEADRRRLASSWGATAARFDRAIGDFAALPGVPALGTLDEALAQTPDVARWAADVERRQAAVAQARTTRTPDLTVTTGYRRFTTTGSNAVILGGTIDLPWFNKSQHAVAAAEAEVARARAEGDAARLQRHAALGDAHASLLAARDRVEALRTRTLPAARSVFDAVREGYQLGRFGLLDVLDAQRALASSERDHLDALISFHAAASAVERLTGQPLPPASPVRIP